MRAGDLRHYVKFYSPRTTDAGAGETEITWRFEYGASAEVKPLKAWEVERARQVQTNRTHLVRIRYTHRIKPDWRIQWGDRIFNIKGIVNPDGRNIELEISCEEEVVTA